MAADTQANIEILKQYLNLGVKLIPVHNGGVFIKSGDPRDLGTANIGEIQDLISGKGYRNELGWESKIKLFRFFPIDYGLVVLDIDKHTNADDGLASWLKIETKLNLPQNCKFENHMCCVHTPSDGFHLYFRLEGNNAEFKAGIADAIDILYTRTVNVAGSVKAGKEYRLIGSLSTIPILPYELKKLMKKPSRIVNIPTNFNAGNKYLSRKEIDSYKPFLREYLDAKGFQVNAKGLTNCPFAEHHKNGDKVPSAHIYPDHLWCYKNQKKYDIWSVAERLNGDDFKAAIADVINALGEIKWTVKKSRKN
jgi:hypothetical protein